MNRYADSVSNATGTHVHDGDGSHHEQEPTYEVILRTLQTCPLGQEDDARHLTRSVILGEN